MITRSDLNEAAFEKMFRHELIEQMVELEMDDATPPQLVEAFRYVIAYNSVPGDFMAGEYDV